MNFVKIGDIKVRQKRMTRPWGANKSVRNQSVRKEK